MNKPRVKKSRAPLEETRFVPWEERIAPTTEQLREWDTWLNKHEPEFEEKYPGHYLAIWDKGIIAATTDRNNVYRLARRARPEVIPLITYVPREQDMLIVPSNFPREWSKADA
ncbi:MAG: hypothetical protein HY257_07740 [Chloroflexi bacterium]|nr:hypothetical protein [Chloroflexota bacterium]